MENFKIEIDINDINQVIKNRIIEKVITILNKNDDNLTTQIDNFFRKSFFDNKNSLFETALNDSLDRIFRQSLEEVMNDLNVKEIVIKKLKELLSSDEYFKEIVYKKIKSII